MGGGSYSSVSRKVRDMEMFVSRGFSYSSGSASEIFASEMNDKMSPVGINIRESRDSEEHPESYPIILGLDVTGSMGTIPLFLIKEGLPKIMTKIIESGIKHPQLLFLGIGDATCDTAPLQVGQFESSDALLDYWLENLWLEGGGGGNDGETYLLAHHFAANHTATDSFEKRMKKGVLITIGDERYLPLESGYLKNVYGEPTQAQMASSLIEDVKAKWEVYHIHTNNRDRQGGVDIAWEWRQLIGNESLIIENDRNKLVDVIVNLILKSFSRQNPSQPLYDNRDTNKDGDKISAINML
jgi:hypothetical protein